MIYENAHEDALEDAPQVVANEDAAKKWSNSFNADS